MTNSLRRKGRVAAGLAWTILAVPTALYFLDSDLAGFFLPLREVVLFAAVIAIGLFLISALRKKQFPLATRIGLVVAVALVLLVYVREFAAYDEETLRFENAGATLEGTLYRPEELGDRPAVVIAQGSIRAPRRLYHWFADRLVREGYAVFSFDKRGTGASGGSYESENNASPENLSLLASDVAAAVEALAGYPGVDSERIGVFGLSMGGWLGPIATTQTDRIAFLVIDSGPAVSVGEEGYFSDLTGDSPSERTADLTEQIEELMEARAPSGFDPRPILLEMDVPTLWLFGKVDSSVPTRKSVAVLDTLISLHGRPYEYAVFPGAEHLGFVMNWPFDLAPGFWETTLSWLERR